jgi:hypothetical protein
MRPAPEAVKLRIANVGRFPSSNKTPERRHPRDQKHRRLRHIRAVHAVFDGPGGASIEASGQIDENGSLPYKPRQLSAMTRFDRGGSFWAGNGPLWARQHPRTYLIYQAFLPGQRRTTREADLSTQQTGAQAPSRLPCPPCDDRWPQGPRRPPRPGPQASERLSRASRRLNHGSAKAAGGLPRRCQWRAGRQCCFRAAKPPPRR